MKKTILTALAVIGTFLSIPTTVVAQTDVTDQYLTNAEFDLTADFVSSIVYTYAKDATEGSVSSCQPVTGWTADATGDAKAGGVFAFGSGYGLSGAAYIVPETNADGASAGGALGLAACWSQNVGYSQPTTLDRGVYRLSYRVFNAGTNNIANYSNTFGFLAENGTAYYDDTEFYSGEWTEGVVYFTLIATTSGHFHVGYDCANVGSGESPKLFVDYVRLERFDELRYTIGDVNEDGTISIADVTALVNVILGKSSAYKDYLADVNEDGTVSTADVTALVNIILGKQEAKTVDLTYQYADLDVMVYAGQSAAENAAGADYTLNKAICTLTGDDVAVQYDMEDYLTTLHITTSLADIASVSIYAIGQENIAGPMTISRQANDLSYSYPTGDATTYASSLESNVISISSPNAQLSTFTAYLRPVALSQGVKVTVRTTDGKFYSQDFNNIQAGAENTLALTTTNAQNLWMATIPGTTYFSMLSTPGAHDAATSGCSEYTYLAKCQADDLSTLLANGVRTFDLRPGYFYGSTISESNLYIYHGQVTTHVLYKDAIRIFAEFLEANPSEAISVIMVKENNKPIFSSWSDRSSEMWTVINAVHTTYGAYMKVLDHSYYTLDDFRGKICYVNRTGTDCTNTVRITNWPDDSSVTDYSCAIGGTCYASVEDAYNANETNKKTAVTQLLNLSSDNTNRARFHYTYTSIAGSLTSNLTGHAAVMNPYTADYITGSINGPAGYVYGDYMGSTSNGGADLLRAIVNQNYKYVFNGRSRVE